ncbi:ArsR/SmtB family transcription factor [Paenibacillus sp. HJGM_3]|uniref:ArsR/SmtB family transcription factor n=1 Tax=Paenibacillus sp. HJGM_3 TaxID=3379816 RepID=UPI003858E5DA
MPVDIFSALADPTRRKILEMLADHDGYPASEIHSQFQISAQAVSQHLKILREANLVYVEKRAQQRIYRIDTEALGELEDWLHNMKRRWSSRLNALDAVLKAEMEKLKKNQKE